MKNTNLKFTCLIAAFFLITALPKLHAQIDLELSMGNSIENPAIWSNFSVTVTLENKGSVAAQNVQVNIPKPAGLKYQGGSEFVTGFGNFWPYGNENWSIATVAPNSTQTITINYFVTSNNVPDGYAQVVNASPNDVDSTPNNGTAPNVNEDDEANTSGGAVPPINIPDLRLSDVQSPPTGDRGSIVNYTLDLDNLGSGTANGDFKIKVWLGNNPNLGGSLFQVGVINTRNIGVGTIDDVAGAFTIPASYGLGTAYVIYQVDADNVIIESDESNNIVARAIVVKEGGNPPPPPSGDFCGFENTYFDFNESANDQSFTQRRPITFRGEETDAGYEFLYSKGIANPIYTSLIINTDGEVLELDENAPAPVAEPLTFEDGSTFRRLDSGIDNQFQVQVRNAVGNISFTRTYANFTDHPTTSVSVTAIKRGTGYVFYGNYRDMTNGDIYVYLLAVDVNGNVTGRYDYNSEDSSTVIANAIGVADNGDLFMTFEFRGIKSISTLRINTDGVVWEEVFIGDLISRRFYQMEYVPSEDALYALYFGDPWAYVRKLSITDGSTIWDTQLEEAFTPNEDIATQSRPLTMIVNQDDGSVITAYRFDVIFSPFYKAGYGKLDRNGNSVWWKALDESYNVKVVTATTDGGFILAGRKDGEFVVRKFDSNGDISPACSGPVGGDGIDLNVTYTANNNNPDLWTNFSATVTVNNEGSETANNVKVSVPKSNGLVYQGGNEYTSSQGDFKIYGSQEWTVGTIPAGGSAILSINYFLTSASRIDLFAEVSEMDGNDIDSSPGNGTIGSATEDDEAVLTINASAPIFRNGAEDLMPNQFRPVILRNIYPNPTSSGFVEVLVSSLEAGLETIVIYDNAGRKVKEIPYGMDAGTNQVRIRTDELISGVYQIQILGRNNKGQTNRFIVQGL